MLSLVWSFFFGQFFNGGTLTGGTTILLPALLQKLIGDCFFAGKFGGKCLGFVRNHKVKAQSFRANFLSIFHKNLVTRQKQFGPTSLCRRRATLRHSPVTRDDSTVTLCILCAATVLSRLLRRFWSAINKEGDVALP